KHTTLAHFAVTLVLGAFSISVHAADKACLIEGDLVVFGQKTENKDCLENSGVPDDQFLAVCKSLVDMSEQLAKTFGGPAPKTTYLAACPPQAKASCVGFVGRPMTNYYYKREGKDLAETKASCIAQGGKW